MKKTKQILTVENFLYIFILICPVLDILSFTFRNTLQVNWSPSTFLRPLIPAIIMVYLFFKKDKKFKIYSILIGLIYLIYGATHLYLFQFVKTGSSYSNVIHEAQYIINYTFMILNLIVFIYTFYNKDKNKLKKCIFISSYIYVISIFIAILTGTSSHTYMVEKMGYKGWFESGNSISAILILSMFVWMNLIKENKYKIPVLILFVLTGLLTTTLIGTRVALLGFILVVGVFVLIEVLFNIIKSKKVPVKYIVAGCAGLLIIGIVIIVLGSNTLKRRQLLQSEGYQIIDEQTGKISAITGDLLEIKRQIENNEFEPCYMGDAEKQSILDLYNISTKLNLTHTQMRLNQLIYNAVLVKNQANLGLVLFGNGYMANFRELVLEMEIPAFLFNFGIIGFILYFIPFAVFLIYTIWKGIKNIKQIDTEYIMLAAGCGLTFVLAVMSGYIFFNMSTVTILIVIICLLLQKVNSFRKEN